MVPTNVDVRCTDSLRKGIQRTIGALHCSPVDPLPPLAVRLLCGELCRERCLFLGVPVSTLPVNYCLSVFSVGPRLVQRLHCMLDSLILVSRAEAWGLRLLGHFAMVLTACDLYTTKRSDVTRCVLYLIEKPFYFDFCIFN